MDDADIIVSHASKKFCKSLRRSMRYGMRDIGRNVCGLSSRSHLLRPGEFWALDDVSFSVNRGEALGLIGPNGSGKSTMLKLLNGIMWPDIGKVAVKGEVGALIEVGAGFHPMLTGRENIYLNASILGMTKRETEERFDDIVEFAEIGDFLDTPVKHYSAGMFVKLGFAVAVHCDPDILLVDEVLAVGDLAFRRKCFKRLGELRDENVTWILVSHDTGSIQHYAEQVIFLDRGKIQFYGSPEDAVSRYLHALSERGVTVVQNARDLHERKPSELIKLLIKRVTLLDENLTERPTFKTGDVLKIRIAYDAFERIENPIFGVAIHDSLGDVCAGTTSKMSRYAVDAIEGPGSVCLHIPSLPLYPGVYMIRANVSDKHFGILDDHDPAAYLNVETGKPGVGVFYLAHSWEKSSDGPGK